MAKGFFLTVLHLFEEEGVACLKRLNGMFGFALWDARLQRLWLEPYERPEGHLVGVVEPDRL
ncbi:MAG: hypothetical protein ACM34H_06325 [Deltaproteobacteria bacterium]